MQDTRTDKRYPWLVLHLIPGLGNIAFKNLLSAFGTPERILQARLPDLMKVNGIRREVARKIVSRDCEKDPARVLKAVDLTGARILSYHDPDYPSLLKEIHDPPMILYLKGKSIPAQKTRVAVVGSRNPTPYGLKVAEEIARGIAMRGLGVVSGMARGIDTAAHEGCLAGGGFTIAVLGTGIDRFYPASNRRLYEQISQHGTLLTEFPPGTPPEPRNFPIRNRIISGLSRGVVVAEATMKSGSLITASLALDQGRDVFAVPGSINSFKSAGSHFLIKRGAALVENADDVLEGIGLNFDGSIKTPAAKEESLPPMDDFERDVFDTLGDYPVHIDQIARETGLDPARVSGILVKMELKGMIRQLPGKMFVR